jgi:peptide/nickel transport system substrate-binding protein
MMYDSLIRQGPDGLDVPWLAESYRIETHEDNPSITQGHTRLTFELVQNATWSDGTPLTGEDVAFTLNYYREGFGNPYGADLTDMQAAYAPTRYSVIVEFEVESYWHLHTVGYKPIIPKHVFQGTNYSNWNLWNPNPPNDVMITSGPFNVSEYVAGEYVELTYNPNYFFGPYIPLEDETDTTSNLEFGWDIGIGTITMTSVIVTSTSLAVIVIVLVLWKLESKKPGGI